ncbi:hypothetical protein [Rhodovastum atsumiense]|nr:hypothetical protein [Rhodovastum atsumiense]
MVASRRSMLQAGVAVLTAGAAVAATEAKAQQKLEKSIVMYQDKPKGDQQCDKCLHWQAPKSCAIIAGDISPTGWCGAFAPKA